LSNVLWSILLAVERDTPSRYIVHTIGGGKEYNLHVHPAVGRKGYTLYTSILMAVEEDTCNPALHTAGGGNGYTLHVHNTGGGKGYNLHPVHNAVLVVMVEGIPVACLYCCW
jgi:hypothetical protein